MIDPALETKYDFHDHFAIISLPFQNKTVWAFFKLLLCKRVIMRDHNITCEISYKMSPCLKL